MELAAGCLRENAIHLKKRELLDCESLSVAAECGFPGCRRLSKWFAEIVLCRMQLLCLVFLHFGFGVTL